MLSRKNAKNTTWENATLLLFHLVSSPLRDCKIYKIAEFFVRDLVCLVLLNLIVCFLHHYTRKILIFGGQVSFRFCSSCRLKVIKVQWILNPYFLYITFISPPDYILQSIQTKYQQHSVREKKTLIGSSYILLMTL